jgi:hypothetical protein
MLDEILKYHETPEDEKFVAGVMKGVRRQQRVRKLILTTTGLVGGAFGAVGMFMIADSLGGLFTSATVLPVSIALVGLAVFVTWLFQDETTALG